MGFVISPVRPHYVVNVAKIEVRSMVTTEHVFVVAVYRLFFCFYIPKVKLNISNFVQLISRHKIRLA